MLRKYSYSILILLLVSVTHAQKRDDLLTLERIFSNFEFYADRLQPTKWIDDGAGYTTLEPSASHEGFLDLVRYETASGARDVLIPGRRLIPEGENEPLYIEDYIWSESKGSVLIYTNSKRVWRQNTRGDYWVLNMTSWKLKKLGRHTNKESTLMFAKFSPDGTRVAYVSENNIFVEYVDQDKVIQITNDGTRVIINGTFDWAYEEEFSCQDGFRWSPDGKSIAYWQLDAGKVRDFYMINNTDSTYSQLIPVQYPKVGTENSACKVGVVSAQGGETKWMNVAGDRRNNYIPRMEWAANSSELIIQQLNRKQNQNNVILCDGGTGNVKTILTETEETWLDVVDDLNFLNNGNQFTWVSQKNGWRNIYKYSRSGDNEQLISPSDFDIMEVQLIDEKGGWVYYTASPQNATQLYLYRSKLSGKGSAQKLSPDNQPGTHRYNISPNGKWAIHTFSIAGNPPVVSVVSLPDHKVINTVISNNRLIASLKKLDINRTEFFTVKAKDGISLDAFMIKPRDFDPSKKYPVLFYVYGEPWGQTVLDSWGSFSYMYHQYLAQNGYVIMSVDNRGTPGPKGREWRKSVYGEIGVKSSADQAAAVREILKKFDFVDADRIGIWGWSGGGAMTLNALFRYPEIYKMGVSVAPVTNQLLYDNIYQERYSGLPSENMEGYKKGSPITYAKNLEGDLLLIHGTGDDNVHYQNTELLINELVRHNKIFSVMPYPNRSHGIYEGENTMRHLYETMFAFIKRNL